MKTQTIIFTLVVVIFGTSALFGQPPVKTQRTNSGNTKSEPGSAGMNLSAASAGSYTDPLLPGAKGTAFLNPEFNNGVLIFHDGTRIADKPLRYNLYTQQMQFIEGNDTLALGNPQQIKYIRIADRVFVYTNYLHKGEHRSGYFELLENGSCRLLKRWSALYHELDPDGNDTGSDEGFYRDCHCYMQFFMNPATPVQVRKKHFLNSFASNSDDINALMKQENLKPKNEADLIKIVDYYNSLQ